MAQKTTKSLTNRIFIQTLAALSLDDLKTFKAFCKQSTAVSTETKNLFNFIIAAYPHFEKLSENEILTQFFPNNTASKKLLNYALHDLMELLQKWLIYQELEEDKQLQQQLLIRAYKKRFVYAQFFKKTNQMLESLENVSLATPRTWHQLFETNFQLFYHVQTPKNQAEVQSFADMESSLNRFYYGSKIRLLCQQMARKKRFSQLIKIDEEEMKQVLYFAQNQYPNPFFTLYAQLIKYLLSPEESDLNEFIKNFKRERTQLDRLDQSILFYIAANSLNTPTMCGNKAASKAQFDLLRYAFKHDLVLFDNEISIGPFNNFLVAACEVGEFKVAQKILRQYQVYFRPSIREEFSNLMQCTIFYYQKKYEKVELNLQNFKFKNSLLRIRKRNLLLKSFYERYQKDETQKKLVLNELISLKKYIRKQKGISETRKNMYYAMIWVIRKLTNAKYSRPLNQKKVEEELKNFIQNDAQKIVSSDWLLEKISQLKSLR